jgi:beta-lactamase class A
VRRRTVITAGTTLLLASAFARRQAALADPGEPDRSPPDPFAGVEHSLGGRIGVAALDTRNGARLAHRSDDRFAMCSTFKWLLAAAVLSKVERSGGTLDQPLRFHAKDLLAHSPVTGSHLAGRVAGQLSLEDLCQAVVEVSDNTAANTLLRYVGGPGAITAYARSLGDPSTRLDRVELSLNSNIPGDPRDTTTPAAMIETMRKVLIGDALSAGSREMLLDWLKNCQTGLQRLRAGLPAGWIVGDKTGTGENGAANDLAIIWPPQRAPILIAAYCDAAEASPDALDSAHAAIGRLVAAAFA